MKRNDRFQPASHLIQSFEEVIHLFGCQQVLLHSDNDTQAILEYISTESNKLFNCAVYYARQIVFKTRKYVSKARLDEEMKSNIHFQAMHSQAAQQSCHSVWEAFKSYRELLKLWKAGELADKPKLPNYRTKGGMAVVSYPKQALKLQNGIIRVPLGTLCKTWFGIDSFTIPMPSNLRFEDIKELRILPHNRCFYAEFVYRLQQVQADVDPSRALGIDHGIDNWLTCVSTLGDSFIVDGKQVKSYNQWWNKEVARLKEGQPQGFWSERLAHITEQRNRRIGDAVNKAARIVINYCLKYRIGTIVFGWNKGQKQEVNLGRKTNQKFICIPTARLKDRIAQLAEQYGMQFIEHEEANTSAASFLDGDSLPAHGEKPVGWKSSGKRVKRGLFRTAMNWYVNADANAGANTLRKVAVTLGLDLSEIGRAALTQPQRIYLWQLERKCEAASLQSAA